MQRVYTLGWESQDSCNKERRLLPAHCPGVPLARETALLVQADVNREQETKANFTCRCRLPNVL